MAQFRVARGAVLTMLLATWLTVAPVAAQADYPTRPIKIVLPVPPGTDLDVFTRSAREP